MSLCYLYSQSISYPYAEKLLDSFSDATSIDIDTVDDIADNDVYIIDINNIEKNTSQKIVNIFKKKQTSLIYFIIPKNYTLLLFQLAFSIDTKALITHSQNLEKTIQKIKADREIFTQNSLERWLGSIKMKTQDFIVYKSNNLIYVSQTLLLSFKCTSIDSFKKEIISKINLQKLLFNDSSCSLDFLEHTFTFKSVSVLPTDKIIYIDKNTQVPTQINTRTQTGSQAKPTFISSRVAFVELLKESVLQKNVSTKHFSLLTINICNITKLLAEYAIVQFEEILLDMLRFIESNLENKRIFSQFENNFYVILFENTDFKEINTIAEDLHRKVLTYISDKDNHVIIDLFTFDLKGHELGEILTTLNQIENEDFQEDKKNSQYIKYLTSRNNKMNAKSLLDDAYKNNLEFKILNIYYGLVINTTAKIIKTTHDNIYISFESLQGVVLNLEKTTVLQSEHFFQDIYAEIKQINTTKKIAILENFKFLKTNANSRQYARVTIPIKIPIKINLDGLTITGSILDLSIKSIAIYVKNFPKLSKDELKKVSLVFNLPNQGSEDGYIQLNLDANIILLSPIEETQYYKIVCDLDQEAPNLDVILKYIYERQKDLILELKKTAKLN